MTGTIPITRESEICQILTAIPEKFVVDFANGIDVAKDHQRVQSERNGFFARCYDGFTGKSSQRQAEINANVINGLEASLSWLSELTHSLAKSNQAISKVNRSVALLNTNMAEQALFSAETRKRLTDLAHQLESRCCALEQEVSRIDFEQRAERHLRQVFTKWEAGLFNGFSIAGRSFAALEELRWGDFGDYCFQNQNSMHTRQRFLEELRHRLLIQLSKDAAIQTDTRIAVRHWLIQPNKAVADSAEALAYLGNWTQAQQHPFAFVATQGCQDLPLELPRICSATRVSDAMVNEIFAGN